MRLIDADILEDELSDSVSDNSTAIHILNEAPTVQAIPIDVLGEIRTEIEQTAKDYDKFDDYRRIRGLWIALEIIDKHIGGKE